MKRKQTRYTTEEQIIEAIDRKKAEAKRCLESAVECDRVVEALHKRVAGLERDIRATKDRSLIDDLTADINGAIHAARLKKEEAVRLSRRRNRIEGTTLPKLKDALAEFRTKLMAYTEDPGVVLK